MNILLFPDKKLVAPNKTLESYTKETASKVSEMFQLMYQTNGVGLAAPQIGWNIKLFILNISGDPSNKNLEKIYFNPTVKLSGELVNDIEGCLSFPNIVALIKRYKEVELTSDTPNGIVTEKFIDFEARAIQHEMDHINSQLFIEKMTPADLKKHSKILDRMRNSTRNS